MQFAYMSGVSIIAYVLSMYLAKKTLSELKQKSGYMSAKTKALQNQRAR
jgi:hypothetical protein